MMQAVTDKKLTEDVREYMQNFIAQRFPEGLPDVLAPVIREIVFDAFLDGVFWGQSMSKTSIIQPGR